MIDRQEERRDGQAEDGFGGGAGQGPDWRSETPAGEREPRWRNKGSWTLGALVLFMLTKGKAALLLLLKLGKPILSMAVTIGAYALLYPWTFAIGLVALIFVHEMGHVWAARRKGLPVSAPLFIPFLGAFILLKRHPKDAMTEATIAMGGPALGSAAALVCYAIGLQTGEAVWIALGYVGFLINLLNLIPVHPLDGGRIVTAVSRWIWAAGVVIGPVAIWVTKSWIFLLIWLWFVWEMYKKFVRDRGRGGPRHYAEGVYRVAVDESLPAWYLSGEQHRRELPYTAYCRLDGQHVVEFWWEPLSFKGELAIDQPCTIDSVSVRRVEGPDDSGHVTLTVRVEGARHESASYYDVPAGFRWRMGLMYGGLALALLYMVWSIQTGGLPDPR